MIVTGQFGYAWSPGPKEMANLDSKIELTRFIQQFDRPHDCMKIPELYIDTFSITTSMLEFENPGSHPEQWSEVVATQVQEIRFPPD